VRFHFEQLHLGERCQGVAGPELGAFLREIEYNGLTRGLVSAQSAQARAVSHLATWGPNRWSTALYFALAEWLTEMGTQ
jgi:hypothetical protein